MAEFSSNSQRPAGHSANSANTLQEISQPTSSLPPATLKDDLSLLKVADLSFTTSIAANNATTYRTLQEAITATLQAMTEDGTVTEATIYNATGGASATGEVWCSVHKRNGDFHVVLTTADELPYLSAPADITVNFSIGNTPAGNCAPRGDEGIRPPGIRFAEAIIANSST